MTCPVQSLVGSVSYWITNLSTPKSRKVVKKRRVTLIWGCTARCRQLSHSEIKSIVALKNLFSEDMAVLREGLDNIDTCPYKHSHKQEWEIPVNPQKADLPECEYTPQEKKGHPLVCHLLGSECKSPLRILRTAVVHFPLLGEFQRQVYTCLAQFKVIRDIDLGIQNKDYQLLLQACGVTFETMFKQTLEANKPSGDGSTPDTPFRVSHLEAALLSEYDTIIERYDKKVRDYALHVCICCEQLFRASNAQKWGLMISRTNLYGWVSKPLHSCQILTWTRSRESSCVAIVSLRLKVMTCQPGVC